MFLKQRKETTDPRVRSLLQKAARRGFCEITEMAVHRLDSSGERTWLRSRAVVITFEECWPLAASLSLSKDSNSKLRSLVDVCQSAKQKDAAGLGALAFAYHEGDRSMVDVVPDRRALRIVAAALQRPEAFFGWASLACQSERQRSVVAAAQRYLAAATWAWDKACILAGAFLAVTGDVPEPTPGGQLTSDFPFWVALDKHTPQGKPVLSEVAAELKVSYRQIIWAGFYFESAVVNKLCLSLWWDAERLWRLRRAGLSVEAGAVLWGRARPLVMKRLLNEASSLRETVMSGFSIQHDLLRDGRLEADRRSVKKE
ncbi:hypothetical protein COSO111634_30930 [Corallococcus soli]